MNKHKIVIILYFVGLSLFFINPVIAEERINNKGFESTYECGARLCPTSWTVSEPGGNKVYTSDYQPRTGTYSLLAIYPSHWVSQSVDFTDADTLTFYVDYTSPGSSTMYVYIDGNLEGTYPVIGDGWNTQRTLDVSGITGYKTLKFQAHVSSGFFRIDDVSLIADPQTYINFNPDYTITNSSTYPYENYYIGSNDVPANPDHRVYYVKLYSYKWINETWDSKTLYQWGIRGQGIQTKVDINYNTDPSGTINRGTFVHYGIGDYYKIQTELVNPFIGVIATDSFIYDNRVNPPPPPPTPEPTPEPTPSNTPTPEPTPTPQPTPEPINETLNTDFIQGYYNVVNESVDGTFEPVYNFTYFIAYPLVSLNESLSNFTIQMNESFNTTSYSIGISTNIFFIIMSSFPQKIINVFTYYLIWVIIQLIFKGDT